MHMYKTKKLRKLEDPKGKGQVDCIPRDGAQLLQVHPPGLALQGLARNGPLPGRPQRLNRRECRFSLARAVAIGSRSARWTNACTNGTVHASGGAGSGSAPAHVASTPPSLAPPSRDVPTMFISEAVMFSVQFFAGIGGCREATPPSIYPYSD